MPEPPATINTYRMGSRLGETHAPERNAAADAAACRGYAPLVPSIAELLARRVRSDGGAPLLTYYDTDDGVRTELSGTTFANWVAKTSNLSPTSC